MSGVHLHSEAQAHHTKCLLAQWAHTTPTRRANAHSRTSCTSMQGAHAHVPTHTRTPRSRNPHHAHPHTVPTQEHTPRTCTGGQAEPVAEGRGAHLLQVGPVGDLALHCAEGSTADLRTDLPFSPTGGALLWRLLDLKVCGCLWGNTGHADCGAAMGLGLRAVPPDSGLGWKEAATL